MPVISNLLLKNFHLTAGQLRLFDAVYHIMRLLQQVVQAIHRSVRPSIIGMYSSANHNNDNVQPFGVIST
jgi:hypothetical protein